jgi:hypothetical protein
LFESRATKRGLASADFAGELNEAFPFADAVEQMIERLAMFRGIEQKARVRRNVERRFCEVEKFLVHADYKAGQVPGAGIKDL